MTEDAEPGFVLSVQYRNKSIDICASASSRLGDIATELLSLTRVAPNTLRLLIPQGRHLPARLIHPLSPELYSLSLQQIGISEGKVIRMMGSSAEELLTVSQPSKSRSDGRIIGFSEEDERARQRSSRGATSKNILSDSVIGQFRTLELPGIELNPPPAQALALMHRLAGDHGVLAVMKKHRWRVGTMSELAPEGYVGISPKCLLGFNKNHGEEISLRLRTDDLKGFRKYESIKKTLMHELAHMVYGEHDENFHRLDKQLNKEVVDLDWTKGTKHSLNASQNFSENMDEDDLDSTQRSVEGFRLGGNSNVAVTKSAQTAAADAALARLGNHQEMENTGNFFNHSQSSNAESNLLDVGDTPIDLQDSTATDSSTVSIEVEKSLDLDTTTTAARLEREVLKLRLQASPAEADVVFRTLLTIIGNALKHPDDAKFRRLRVKNPSFQQRVGKFKEALEVLKMIGFSETMCDIEGTREECLVLHKNDHGLLSLANSSIEKLLV